MLEVVNNALSVQKVHGNCEKVPIQRFGQWKVLLLSRHLRNGDDFFEGNDLNSGDHYQHVDVSCKHATKKPSNHSQCPYRARDEGRLLFLVL
jgi:hypothetical protein